MPDRAAPSVRLAVVDDHDLVVDGLVSALAAGTGTEVVYAGASLASAEAARADVVLLDVGVAASAAAGQPAPASVDRTVRRLGDGGSAVLLISAQPVPETVLAGLRAGARGYLAKGASANALADAVHDAAAGRAHVSRDLVSLLLAFPAPPDVDPGDVALLRLIAAGLPTDAVATRLRCTPAQIRARLTTATAAWVAAAPD